MEDVMMEDQQPAAQAQHQQQWRDPGLPRPGVVEGAAAMEDGSRVQQHQQQPNDLVRERELNGELLRSLLGAVNVRMIISNEERARALAIKQAVEADAELRHVTDMMYAQLAIVDLDDLELSLDRIRQLQYFRDEYEIQDNFYEGRAVSQRFIKQHPGHILSISYNSMEGNYVIIYDQASFDEETLKKPGNWRTFFAYGWYLYHSLSPDLHAIRQGMVLIAECDGLDWKKLDMKTMERVWTELLVNYPVSFRELKFFHTGVTANLTVGLMKQFLPRSISSKFNLGCQFDGRLDTYYRIPTDELADQRVQAELECFLHLRYENERLFQL